MRTITTSQSITFWSTKAGAQTLADQLAQDDPGMEYRVVENASRPGNRFCIAVKDEDGRFLGYV